MGTLECPRCGRPTTEQDLAESHWANEAITNQLRVAHPEWPPEAGACVACVQEGLLLLLIQEGRVDELKLVTRHCQHVDGTSFATPLVAAAVTCLLEANPRLDPGQVRNVLQATAETIPGVPIERQGHGVIDVGQAIALARHLRRGARLDWRRVPQVTPEGILYALDADDATQVELLGSWDGWQPPGLLATETEPGLWVIYQDLLPSGVYQYKFKIDGQRWLLDPSNRARVPDGAGGLNSVLTVP